jgi:hypothetical protein
MRLTISLDEHLYAAVKSIARADDVSLSAAVNALLRRAVFPANEPILVPSVRNGLQVLEGRGPVSSEDVRRMEERLEEEYGGAKK